jgi:hypothetical protein
MIPLFEPQVEAFFHSIAAKNALLLTTFGLDEAVLVRLLSTHEIHSRQRIVVFHEIMKHRNPGLLQAHYENSKVVSVEIAKNHRNNICPIFHSKVWMEVTKVPLRCVRLAVLSGNLTRYHLDSDVDGKTCETFSYRTDTAIKLPHGSIFNKKLIFEGHGKTRIKLARATLIIDDSESAIRFSNTNEPVHNTIARIIDDGDHVIGCAAPFVNKTPVQTLNEENHPLRIWSGEKKDGTRLHAKIVETKKYVIMGSPNITKQAYGLSDYGIVNHEALLISKKPKAFSLLKILKGFTRIEPKQLDDHEKEPDSDYDGYFDWMQQKEWAVHGPDSVTLVLNETTKRVEIIIRGSLDKVSKITLHSYENGKESPSILESPARQHLKLKMAAQQQKLATAVLCPPVIVKGWKGRKNKPVWVRELNLGEFWNWIENNVVFIKSLSTSGSDNGEMLKNDSSKKVLFDDVRELRLKAYTQRKSSIRVQLWHNWISKYSKYGSVGQGMPNWCIELGKRLRRLKDA